MKHHPHRQTRMPGRQLDLLAPNPPPARHPAPEWGLLPQQTRRALTGLLTRLLIEHAGDRTRDPRRPADER